MATHLVWFRNDLRITDNTALTAACQHPSDRVIALYIATPQQWHQHDMAAVQAGFIYANLCTLQQSLASIGIPLLVLEVNDFGGIASAITQVCQQHQVDALFYNRQYPLNERRRDQAVEQTLSPEVDCHGFDDALLFPPMSILTGKGEMYQIYTPFRHALIHHLQTKLQPVLPAPKQRGGEVNTTDIPPFNYPLDSHDAFPAGEQPALQRLRRFCRENVMDYERYRDIPAQDMTSRLSPYLAIGVLSVRQCYHRLLAESADFLLQPQSGAFAWFNELAWREFYHHLLVAWPKLSMNKPFIGWTERIHWNPSHDDFQRWCDGETGYPIVDAAMRQMNHTGWMHNRLRMIVASFLVKDLLIDWRRGEHYFMSRLIDGDLAANNGGWQWAASTGTDAAPYFRIFNPTTQGKRFDPQGHFIRQWLPELGDVPDKWIHTPHQWSEKQGKPIDYPTPIVDHATARIATLVAFEQARKPQAIGED
ncbi:deoxyribodipyrimidine photo-lyase [Pragia fontium]|uniref:Deoxyribodipyrimidine photo-lyase n=1 Tax=Pragia fontium TaxID=82985 RepID=A0ABQ5LEN4_9GAMM|nr:deoxyribodipyrimidine photo-lyase [Pragia fontium]GKX62076.1 deoxyribodipyrimidine photo-lyase [Pragia fontium]